MAGIENNLSAMRLIESMKNEVTRGKSEVFELAKKLCGTVDSHSSSINKGLDNLAREVCGLQAKLEVITKERDDLLDTVNDLRGEIGRLNAKPLPTIQPFQLWPLPELKPNHSQDLQDVESSDDTNRNARGQGVEISNEEGNMVENLDFGGNVDKIAKGLIKIPLNDQNHLKASDLTFKCPQCPYSTVQKHHIRAHVEGVHAETKNHRCEACEYTTSRRHSLKRHLETVHKMGDRKFKCEQCPLSTAQKHHLRAHVEAVHDKIRDFRCDQCGYATSRKSSLKRHKEAIHRKGE